MIARERPEELSAVAERGLLSTNPRYLGDNFIEGVPPVKSVSRHAPQGFADREVNTAKAVQRLFGAVIEARDASETIKTSNPHGELIVEATRLARIAEIESSVHIMIVQKGDEVARSFAMRTEQTALDILPMLKHVAYSRRWLVAFEHFREFKKQGKVQGRIDADRVLDRSRIAANELRDLLFIVEDFPECEEVLFPDAESILAHRVTENAREIPLHVLERVDSKAVDVEFGDRVLIRADQDLANSCSIRDEFLKRIEVTAAFAALAFAAKKVVAVQFT